MNKNQLKGIKNYFCDVDSKKNALYFINSTIRNTTRINDFLLIANKYNNKKILVETFLKDSTAANILKNFESQKKTQEENKLEAYTRRFDELKKLNLIDYKISKDNHTQKKYISFNNTIYYYELFNPKNYNEKENDCDYLEVISNMLLFLLKKRNTLNFITYLILEVENKWINEKKRRRLGIADKELEAIYVLMPYLKYKNENDVKHIAELIINFREQFETNKKLDSKLKYSDFIKKHVEKEEINNSISGSNIKFIQLSSAKEYIDVTFRTLKATGCFSYHHQHIMKSISIEKLFISKLNYFLEKEFHSELSQELISGQLFENLNKYEIEFYNSNGIKVSNPIYFRYSRFLHEKKISYINYSNKEKQQEEIKFLIEDFQKNPTWYDFEHLNNYIMSYYLKFNLGLKFKEKDIKYAIKIDQEGNIKNSTTSGIEDFSINTENFTIVLESSTLRNLESRKYEVASVKTHVEEIYKKQEKKKPILTIIVLKDNPYEPLQEDYIESNIFNNLRNRDIFYLPLSFNQFKSNFFNNTKTTTIIEIINDLKENTKKIINDLKENTERQKAVKAKNYTTFSDIEWTSITF